MIWAHGRQTKRGCASCLTPGLPLTHAGFRRPGRDGGRWHPRAGKAFVSESLHASYMYIGLTTTWRGVASHRKEGSGHRMGMSVVWQVRRGRNASVSKVRLTSALG